MELSYTVAGMTCSRCVEAIEQEVGGVPGVSAVVADLATKRVTVSGAGVNDGAVRVAIDEAGYEAG